MTASTPSPSAASRPVLPDAEPMVDETTEQLDAIPGRFSRPAGALTSWIGTHSFRVRANRWPYYAAGAVVALYALVFVRGLGWEWRGILTSTNATVPVVANAPRSAAAPAAPPNAPAQNGQTGQAAPAAPAAPAAARAPLPPTDEPAPRNTTDKYGVSYDQNGVAVSGIDADPSGVYNVPPGRQLRIGGPQGALFDVEPGGKLKPATAIRQ